MIDLSKAAAEINTTVMSTLLDEGEFLLQEANKTVPFDEGTLARSGQVTPDPANTRVIVSYDTPYAITQHEDTRLTHPNGRRAKWLQATLNEQAETIKRRLAEKLEGVL